MGTARKLCVCGHKKFDHQTWAGPGMQGTTGIGRGYCTLVDEDGVQYQCLKFTEQKRN